jgi:hypothetical protein
MRRIEQAEAELHLSIHYLSQVDKHETPTTCGISVPDIFNSRRERSPIHRKEEIV